MGETLHIHLNPVGGIAGDMFVAAMLQARPDLAARVLADVARVVPVHAGAARLVEAVSGGLAALHFSLAGPLAGAAQDHHPGHRHHGAHDAHSQAHHPAKPEHRPRASEGTFAGMRALILAAALSAGTAEAAIGILTILAEAEARMHRMPVEQVHFHEIGDWDSLMDVVAAGSIAAALAGATWSVAPLPLGGGMVKTAHGLLPVPAPATTDILRGFDWRDDGIEGERVTPTGAAILRFLVGSEPGPRPSRARLVVTGYGAGTRHLVGMPNVLRASLFVAGDAAREDALLCVAFDIDDMTGEEIAVAAERLRAVAGVRDLHLTSAIGKKCRPLTGFRILVDPAAFDVLAEQVFLQTSTLGLRWHELHRRVLARAPGLAAHGLATKHARRPDGSITAKVESDALQAGETLAARRRLQKAAD